MVKEPKVEQILFSGPMVRAIGDGSKTQTRRVLSCPACGGRGVIFRSPGIHGGCPVTCSICDGYGDKRQRFSVGDLLWVCEAWRTDAALNGFKPSLLNSNAPVQYEADGARSPNWRADLQAEDVPGRLRPSMFMPRWASRFTLEVVKVMVQRLQNISEASAMAEGVRESREIVDIVPHPNGQPMEVMGDRYHVLGVHDDEDGFEDATSAFRDLWDSLNAQRGFGWSADPMVVAVTFKLHRCNVDKIGEAT